MKLRAEGGKPQTVIQVSRWEQPRLASSSGDKSSQEVPGGLDRETIARVVHVCVSVSRNKLMLN